MVTLQILVLSFLVRIQVAQLKRLSFEGRFFCVCVGVVVYSTQGVHVVLDYYAPMQALCKSPNSPQPRLSTPLHNPILASYYCFGVVLSDSHFVLVEPI